MSVLNTNINKLKKITDTLKKSKEIDDQINGLFLSKKIEYYQEQYFDHVGIVHPSKMYQKYKELKRYFHKYI